MREKKRERDRKKNRERKKERKREKKIDEEKIAWGLNDRHSQNMHCLILTQGLIPKSNFNYENSLPADHTQIYCSDLLPNYLSCDARIVQKDWREREREREREGTERKKERERERERVRKERARG
jgi:hypothetical protein